MYVSSNGGIIMKFYVLEYSKIPGMYYLGNNFIENEFGCTNDILNAKRFSNHQEAICKLKKPSDWLLREVTISIQ